MNASLALAGAHLVHDVPGLQLAELNPNKVTPGLLGFVVFAAIGGAVWLLMKSMNRQFQKVNFEEAPGPAGAKVPGQAPGRAQDRASGTAARAAEGRETGDAAPADGA